VARLCAAWAEELGDLVADTGHWLHERMESGAQVLFEGAQGLLLDLDHGTYPFVTSSTTGAAGIATGLGIAPRRVDRVVAVMKAYCTRVGAGPFPTEDEGEVGDRLREVGKEFGTTTGRPRRCGWFDAVAARYAARLNGLDGLAVTKFDVLDEIDEIPVAVGYRLDGEERPTPPADADDLARIEPVYERLAGWRTSTREARRLEDLPGAARAYLDRLAELTEVPVALVSVGPDREATVLDPASSLGEWLGARNG
jgi:adenylosuccinate synthase